MYPIYAMIMYPILCFQSSKCALGWYEDEVLDNCKKPKVGPKTRFLPLVKQAPTLVLWLKPPLPNEFWVPSEHYIKFLALFRLN
jgi:hypothetical protein